MTEFRNNVGMGDFESLGKRVKRLRLAANLTQAQLAEKSTLSPGTIGDIESDRQGAGKKIDRLAAALGTTAEYLRAGVNGAPVIAEAMLSSRESQLIERFRSMSPLGKQRLEDFAAGIQGAIKKRRPRISETAREDRHAKGRRSG